MTERTRRAMDPRELERRKRLAEQGMTCVEAADRLRITYHAAYLYARRHGFEWTREREPKNG